ncbi:MAG: Gfo/Idh/MocA family oxidoreductase [Enterocloster asparagiformis]|nr:Gfo/Idh/MocA family oxidoreductase [Enterocloster asparagiformis]
MIRYGTIGTNFVVKWFLEAAKKCGNLHYSAAYSRSMEKAREFAQQYGADRGTDSLTELAEAEDVDAVYIASPNSLHFEQAALMLSHGKHVLCEKTVTTNRRELVRLLEIADERGLVFMEALRSSFIPAFDLVRDNLGKLGTIRRVSLQYGKYSSRYDKFRAGVVENAFDPSLSNGALMDIGVYCVHTLVKLFGLPEKILADAVFLENGVDGAGTILASYGGMQAEVLYSKITTNRCPCQIQGEEATMVIRGDLTNPDEIVIWYRNGEKESFTPEGREDTMLPEVKEWLRLMESGESGAAHNRCSLMALEVMDEARRQLGIVYPADRRELWKQR